MSAIGEGVARWFLGGSMLLGLGLFAVLSTDCASSRCQFQSDCPIGRCVGGTCTKECQEDIDCPSSAPSCKAGVCYLADGGPAPTTDAAAEASTTEAGADDASDATVTTDGGTTTLGATDTGATTIVATDTGVSTPETAAAKPLLDLCASDAECNSGHCATGAVRFCTPSCTTFADCPLGLSCSSAGLCAIDDTGKACTASGAGSCITGLCIGTSTAAHCTHECGSGADCPAGFACTRDAGSGKKICIDIERPCGTNACPSALCLGGADGCTAKCEVDADCPVRATGITGITSYRCQNVGGTMVCVPPASPEITGSDPLGTTCPASGTNTCRSGLCDTGASSPICNEACTPRGGCTSGWGCFPDVIDATAGTISYLCNRAGGTAWVGQSCARAADCVTGMCQGRPSGGAFCTRVCDDGLCPTGLTCTAAGTSAEGYAVKICN
jgi:hypothetical protein